MGIDLKYQIHRSGASVAFGGLDDAIGHEAAAAAARVVGRRVGRRVLPAVGALDGLAVLALLLQHGQAPGGPTIKFRKDLKRM